MKWLDVVRPERIGRQWLTVGALGTAISLAACILGASLPGGIALLVSLGVLGRGLHELGRSRADTPGC